MHMNTWANWSNKQTKKKNNLNAWHTLAVIYIPIITAFNWLKTTKIEWLKTINDCLLMGLLLIWFVHSVLYASSWIILAGSFWSLLPLKKCNNFIIECRCLGNTQLFYRVKCWMWFIILSFKFSQGRKEAWQQNKTERHTFRLHLCILKTITQIDSRVCKKERGEEGKDSNEDHNKRITHHQFESWTTMTWISSHSMIYPTMRFMSQHQLKFGQRVRGHQYNRFTNIFYRSSFGIFHFEW